MQTSAFMLFVHACFHLKCFAINLVCVNTFLKDNSLAGLDVCGKDRMNVIVLASQKGGVGKTTLAGHLAVQATLAGDGPVAILDTDPQASLAEWWNARAAELPIFSPATIGSLKGQLAALAKADFAYAFIDTQGAITDAIKTVIALADFVLIPVKPSPHDLRAVGHSVSLVTEGGKPFSFVITQAKQNTLLTLQSMAALSAHGVVSPAIMHDRVDYAASMTDGRTVMETDPKGRSAAEITELWDFVKARMNASTKNRKADTS